jgi:hypothetical protein
MATNPPGPFLFVIPTITDGLSHDITVNCDVYAEPDPGTDPGDVNMRTKDGEGASLSACANNFWAIVRAAFGTTTLASTFTLYKLGVNNNDRQFISAGTLATPNGQFGTYVPAQQLTMTWRGGGGGIAKLQLMECNVAGNSRVPSVSSVESVIVGINTFIMSDENFLMARERSFPVASMNASLGQNEKVWRRRFRN